MMLLPGSLFWGELKIFAPPSPKVDSHLIKVIESADGDIMSATRLYSIRIKKIVEKGTHKN